MYVKLHLIARPVENNGGCWDTIMTEAETKVKCEISHSK